MSIYEILPCNDKLYMCIIFPTSYYDPLKDIDFLTKQLNEKYTISGYVLFDFLLSTGNTSERFAKVFFDKNFVTNTFSYITLDTNDTIRDEVSNFLKRNSFYMSYSVLTNSQRYLIEQGYLV